MLKNKLFYIGVLIFSLTLFVEQLFSIQTALTNFIKGFGIGLELAGVIVFIMKKK